MLTAQKAASEVKKKAREKADDLLAESARTVQTTVTDAKEKAEKIVSDAREYAAKLTKEKTEAAGEILSEAKEKAKRKPQMQKRIHPLFWKRQKQFPSSLFQKQKRKRALRQFGSVA